MKFFIPGIPKPAGSKRAFVVKGKAILTDASGKAGKDWRGDCKRFATEAHPEPPSDGPIELHVTFQMPRPKGHYTSNGALKPSAPHHHTKRPDATKLLRGLEDALTGILWADDSQIAVQMVSKVYSERPGATVKVFGLCEF